MTSAGFDAMARRCLRAILCAAATALAGIVCAEAPGPNVQAPPLARDDAARLVDSLASSNSPFIITGKVGSQKVQLGASYDDTEHTRVRNAVHKAIQHSESIWPELVEHLEDARHCKTVGIDAGYPRNWTVGDVCQEIIGSRLSVAYYRHLPGTKEVYHRFHLPEIAKDKKLLQAWCRKNKDKKLYELQIEMCRWAIGELNEFDHKALAKPTAIREIERTIETLERTRVPVSSSRSF